MSDGELVIATFNTEWRKTASADAGLIRERLGDVDVACLTEAYCDFFGEEGHLLEPPHDGEGDDDGRRKVLLWSKRPWTTARIGEGSFPGHFLAGTTETTIGIITVYGVVIPYRFSEVRYGSPKRKLWERHFAFLENLNRLLPAEPERSIILGDFNQRFPPKYQPAAAGEKLKDVVLRKFELASAGLIPKIGKQAIDHICHTGDFALKRLEGLSNLRSDGRKISDHFGLQAVYGAKVD